ncbi:putative Fusobacterium necrophorum leukotoxin lktA like protein (plasmid) [Selenomonas ruminantium subsp. lactilytica TAM6421]|uniref:Putative Fusobacterium necrophorum leukotoxin lktA like protein n=2 Tax=Selenomonas ruminantium TaxID=971 RepID=I0GVK7_SELRL|nr:putative Fusobacterium necrophorum leukotoxin lktA like protein [Selenomonas ruminantium subsp. lactilytica TAM6421]
MLASAAMPSLAEAQNIEKVNGTKYNDTVNHIYADKMVNSTAVNAFKSFKLDAGNIANMHMGTAPGSTNASSLVNFVNNQASISGTVNAVKNGGIGGNLYFLSPNGVVVGSTGVINAGSVHLMAPSQSEYNAMVGDSGVNDTAFSQRWSSIQDGTIPLNAAGTITVSGQIHAVDGISAHAGKIEIKNSANIINNDSVDFSSLVNVSDTVKAGLTSNLQLQKSGDSGAIKLAAVGDNSAQWDVTDVDLKPKAEIEKGAVIKGDGEVNISAEAKNAGSMMLSSMTATVDVDGSVTGDTVDISATAEDEFALSRGNQISEAFNKQLDLPTLAGDILSFADIDVSLAVHDAKAEVNIGKDAVITATGKDTVTDNDGKQEVTRALNVSAESSLSGAIATEPDSFTGEIFDIAKEHFKWKQGAQNTSIGVGVVKNNAEVNVKGKLATTDEEGGVSVKASAPMVFEGDISNTIYKDSDNAFLALGTGVVVSENHSNVKLENSAQLTDIAGDFEAAADAENKLSLSVSVKGFDNTSVATAAAVLVHDSSADVKVDTEIAAADVSLDADNTVKKLSVKAKNGLGSGDGTPANTGLLTTSDKYMSNLQYSIFGKITGREIEEPDPLFENLSELFNAGASVGVASASNTAKVTLTPQADINAVGAVDISSAVSTESLRMNSSGSAGNAKQHKIDDENSESHQKVKVEASVLVADLENKADVVVEEGTEDSHAVIKGSEVSIGTKNTFTYDNIESMKKALKDAATAKTLREAGPDISKAYDELVEAWDAYEEDKGRFGAVASAASGLLSALGEIPSGLSELASVKNKLTAFIDPASYGTFYVGPKTSGGKLGNIDPTANNSKFAVAGAADIALLDDTSKVSLGKYAQISATDKVNITSDLTRDDASVNGVLGLMNSGDQNSVGGIFSFYNADRTSKVTLGDHVSVTGSGIATEATKDTSHLSVAAGAGKGGSAGITAMVSMVQGSDTAAVEVGNDTNLNALNGGKVAISTDNDTQITNIAGSVGIGTSAGIGAAVAVTDVSRDSLLTIGRATIQGGSADFFAVNGGMINTAAVAGGVVANDDTENVGKLAKFQNWMQNQKNKVSNVSRKLNDATKKIIPDKLKAAMEVKDNKMLKTDNVAKNPQAGKELPSISVAGAGSVAVSLGDAATKSVIDGAAITLTKSSQPGLLSAHAVDTGYTGSYAGAAGIAWNNHTGPNNENSRTVGVAGAVGWVSGENDVISAIKNSTVNASIDNYAEKSGAGVAAGLGLALAKGGSAAGGSSTSAAASLSVIDLDNTVKAELKNDTVTGDSVTNRAIDADTLVAGGVNASIALGKSKGTAVGGSVVVNRVHNDMDALIDGGSYTLTGDLANKVSTNITEIGAAIGVSVAQSSGFDGSAYGIEGVAAYNGLTNEATAEISGATIAAKNVTVDARDSKDTSKKYDEYINKSGLDATGASYAENLKDALDSDGKADISSSGGNTVVSAAVGVGASVSEGGAAAAAAAAISEVKNDFTAAVTNNSKITGNNGSIQTKADSRTLMINAAAGGGGTSDGWGVGGSFSWQTDANTVTAKVENSDIKGMPISVIDAGTAAKAINVAGQVSVGNVAVGLAGAYNRLENTTGAYVKNSQFTDNTTKSLAISAKNEGRVYAVTAGVAASREKLAANGAVAVNSGADNIKAELSGGTVKNATSISVASEDDTKKLAVAGGFTLSQGTAIGGAVAYNAIGDTDRQVNSATINGTTIDHNTSKINVTATDNSGLTTIGFGVGLANGSPAVNGAAAVGLKSADVTAEVVNTNVKNSTGNISVKASTDDDFSTNAAVAAVGESAAIGVGVGVTRDETHTTAKFSGGSFTGNDFDLGAASHADITTVGVGGGVNYGSGLGLAGSATVNLIDTETKALVNNGANISAKSPAITAISDEKIANYVGALSVSSQGAAIGASVSVNEIDSETEAAVEGANTVIKSTGDATHSVKDTVSDDAILDKYADQDLFKSSDSLKDARTAKSYTGLLVDASGTHTMKSFLVNAGGTGTGAAVNGTVDVNLIGGSTKARITDARINNASANKSNVNVIAHDYANSAGGVGTVNIAMEGGAVGLGSDTNKITRTTEASLIGPSAKYDLYANDVNIEAKSRQGVGSFAAGASFAGEGAAVNAASGVTLLDGTTNAFLKNVNIKNAGNISLTADHLSRSHLIGTVFTGAGIGAGLSIAVGYVSDTGTTEATAENINVEYAANKKGDLNVKANNEMKVNYTEIGIGAAGVGAGLAGSIGVSEASSTTKAQLKNSTIGTSSKRAKNANITANNQLILDQKAGVGSAGAAGVGVGVSVNKLDSTTNVNIENSKVYAGAINAGASDNKDIWQTAGNASIGGSAMGLNVMVTNVGKDISSTYDAGDGKTKINVSNVFQDINDAMKAGNLSKEESHGVVDSDGKNITNTRDTVIMTAKKKDSASGLTVMGSTLDSAGDVTLLAGTETNAEMKSVVATAGGSAAISGTVAVLDVAGNSVGEVRNSTIKANAGDITIASYQGGLSELEVKQGSLSGTLALSGAYGKVSKSGLTDLQLSGNTMNAKNLSIGASDESRAKIDALGASGAIAGSVNVLIGDVENKGKVSVALQGGNTLKTSDKLLVVASRGPEKDDQKTAEVTTQAVSAAIGVAGTGISATAHDASETAVTLNTAKNKNANSLSAGTIGITALNSPNVKTETKSAAASLLVSGAVTVADSSAGTKSAPIKSTVDIGDGTSLLADETEILAQNEIGLSTDMKGLGISGYVAAQVNTGRADAYGNSQINLGKVNVQERGILMAMSNTNVTKDIKAAGVSAAGLVASGTNVAKSDSVLNSAINANGTNDKQLQIALLLSTASEDNTARADGDGGAAVDISPYAAKLENSLTTNTKTNVGGNWNASLFAAGAELTDKHDFTTDATRAAIAGGSGVGITNTATHTTAINVNNANIRTKFTQGYNANNNIDYKDTQKAGSYGGVTGSDSAVKNTINATADVNITGGTLKGQDVSSLRAQAKTDSKIVSKNNVEGAGVVQILVGSSDADTSFTDRVTVTNANLSTEKGDISLAATSDIDHDLEAESVDEGGAAGVTTVKNTNKLTRKDKIDITGTTKLASGHDLMLLAGADENKTPSNLRLLTYANAHNATFIPAETSPTINETLTLDRGVTVGSGANTTSIRHTYLRADEGTSYIEESARQFKIWGQGETGKRRLTSTALGDSDVSQNKTAKVDVQGKVTAGLHNQLDIDITGDFKRDSNGGLDISGVKVTAKQGWVNVANTTKTLTKENPYSERYDEVLNAMKDYTPGSKEYSLLESEVNAIVAAMDSEGFLYRDTNGNTAILREIPMAGLEFEDINVSGGNVIVNAASLAGDKNITANGAPQVNITNNGNAYLLLNNVKIEEGGGRLYQNDQIIRDAAGESAINIKSLGKEDKDRLSRPDISIAGNVENNSGAVSISNKNYDVDITGSVNGKSVSVIAEKGSINLSRPTGFVNVGRDPIAKYMFDEKTAEKIQKYYTSRSADNLIGIKSPGYSYYKDFLKRDIGLTGVEMMYEDNSEKTGYIAGGNITITAKDVNINGLIQSGYTNYTNKVNNNDLYKVESKAKIYKFSDDDVIGNEKCQVGQKGMIWNDKTKMYDYAVPIYYNPSTGHLLTEDIDVRGGHVDIKGNIINTGSGRIVVADGVADISLDTIGTGRELYVGRITNNDRDGFIRISDTMRGQVYESTGTMHRVYTPGNAAAAKWETGKSTGYTPVPSAFTWTGGTSGQTVVDKYYRKYYVSAFGMFNL